MNDELKTIQIGKGLGALKFGMNREDVRDLLGEPDEKESYSYSGSEEGDMTEVWHYDSHYLSASFDEESNWRLAILSVSSADYKLKGENLIGLHRKELFPKLKEMNLGELESDDMGGNGVPDQEMIWAFESGINFWLDNGVLTEIEWSPIISEEGEMQWP